MQMMLTHAIPSALTMPTKKSHSQVSKLKSPRPIPKRSRITTVSMLPIIPLRTITYSDNFNRSIPKEYQLPSPVTEQHSAPHHLLRRHHHPHQTAATQSYLPDPVTLAQE